VPGATAPNQPPDDAPARAPGGRSDPAAGPWLSAAEQRAWRSWLAAERLLVDRLDRQLQDESGMSHADYEILVHLSEADDDRMRMSELAEQALFSRSRLSHAVSRLERLGWVAREDCPTDRRGMFAVLTPPGLAALEAAAPGHVATVRRFVIDALGPDGVAQLERLTTCIRGALEERGPTPTG